MNFHPNYTCLISSNAKSRVELWKNVLTINKPFLSKFSPNLILSERQRRHIFWIMMEIKRGLFQIKLVPMWRPKCFAGCLPEKLNGHRWMGHKCELCPPPSISSLKLLGQAKKGKYFVLLVLLRTTKTCVNCLWRQVTPLVQTQTGPFCNSWRASSPTKIFA